MRWVTGPKVSYSSATTIGAMFSVSYFEMTRTHLKRKIKNGSAGSALDADHDAIPADPADSGGITNNLLRQKQVQRSPPMIDSK